MNSSTANSNTNFPPYHLLSRFHQHLNHLNDMAFTHTKILQEIIEKRSNEPILSSPNGSISSSPSSSSASTIDSIQQRKRSYPSNDNQEIKNENHLNKRPRKQSKPQQLLKIEDKNISNGQSTSENDDADDEEEEEEMGEITQRIEKENPLSIPPSSTLPYPPFLNYIQDLARTNSSTSMNHFLENLALESRRLATFSLPPLFSQQQNPYLSQLMLNNSFLNHFPPPPPPPTINRFIPQMNVGLKDHPTFPFHFSTPKKRRTKVTDTRLSPRIASKIPLDDFSDDDNASSPHSSDDQPSKSLDYHSFQVPGLTPLHLRKAKLMFFYTRYPSSAVLKNYFADVRFDKMITAQLVKWFSNFREFFYQQIEKYARQCLAEGIRNVDDLVVTSTSELYRVLNVHYNRSNQITVPTSFCTATQAALREFFVAILQQKDLESSWKKSIYKVMQRLDDQIPDFFKNDHWMHSI